MSPPPEIALPAVQLTTAGVLGVFVVGLPVKVCR